MQALARLGGRLLLLGKAPLARSQPPALGAASAPSRALARAHLRLPAAALLPAPFLAPAPLPSVAPWGLAPDWPTAPALPTLPTPRPPAPSLKSLPGSGRVPTGGPGSAGGLAQALPRAGPSGGWRSVPTRGCWALRPRRPPRGWRQVAPDLAGTDPGYCRLLGGVFHSFGVFLYGVNSGKCARLLPQSESLPITTPIPAEFRLD